MIDLQFKLSSSTSLNELSENRLLYKNIKWLSLHKVEIPIWELEDNHILLCLRDISIAIQTSKIFPLIQDFKSYNGVSYNNYAQFLYNEFLFREAVLQHQYEDYLDEQIVRMEYYKP